MKQMKQELISGMDKMLEVIRQGNSSDEQLLVMLARRNDKVRYDSVRDIMRINEVLVDAIERLKSMVEKTSDENKIRECAHYYNELCLKAQKLISPITETLK